jgi:hypothetical protein
MNGSAAKSGSGTPPLDPPFRRRFHSAARRFGGTHVAALDPHSHRVPAQSREEIDGFDLYLADGTAVTLERGDGAFEQVLAELRDQEIEVAVGR